MRISLVGVGICVATLCVANASHAQSPAATYPVRSVRFVIPFTPGGTADIIARVMAPKMSGGLGQQVVIDGQIRGHGHLPHKSLHIQVTARKRGHGGYSGTFTSTLLPHRKFPVREQLLGIHLA